MKKMRIGRIAGFVCSLLNTNEFDSRIGKGTSDTNISSSDVCRVQQLQ